MGFEGVTDILTIKAHSSSDSRRIQATEPSGVRVRVEEELALCSFAKPTSRKARTAVQSDTSRESL